MTTAMTILNQFLLICLAAAGCGLAVCGMGVLKAIRDSFDAKTRMYENMTEDRDAR